MSSAFPSDLPRSTVKLTSGRTLEVVEIAPGVHVADLPAGAAPPIHGFMEMASIGEGKYVPRVKTWSEQLKIGEQVSEELGLGPLAPRVFRRLAAAGFITVTQLTPGIALLDLASLFKHLEATKDPEFWTEARRARYSQAAAEIR